MDITEYCNTAAYGTRVYLAKEKPENTPKARLLYQRLWFLDVSTKLLFTYWMAQKWLTYFNITIHWSQWRFRPNDVDYLVTIKKYILKFIIMKKNTNKEHLFRLFNYFYWNELLGSTELKKKCWPFFVMEHVYLNWKWIPVLPWILLIAWYVKCDYEQTDKNNWRVRW